MDRHEVIIRPIVFSEKANRMKEASNQYVFIVNMRANKIQIRDAVQTLFRVKVEDVRTMIRRGHLTRMGMRHVKRQNRKKAIVTLQAGQTIELFK